MSLKPITENKLLCKSFSLAEEIANSITHGLGVLLSVAGLTLLVTFAAHQADVWRVVSFSIYGTTLVLVFLASTLYHSFQHPKAKRIFKTIDHCSIYVFIAGSYTPFLLVSMRSTMGWALFSVIWILAVAGIIFKVTFGLRFEKLSIGTYMFMGWLVLVASSELMNKLPLGGIYWLLAGGLVYTSGVLFYLWERLPFNHAIWHIFVLVGSVCHFLSVYLYVLPPV